MQHFIDTAHDRRAIVRNGLLLAGLAAVPGVASASHRLTARDLTPLSQPPLPASVDLAATPLTSPHVVRPELMRRALASLQRHGERIAHRDKIAIVDFAAPSSQPRFHIVDLASGASAAMLVAHGAGSDPSHSGWLSRFSNEFNSNASCEGAFLADDYYVGKHGRSQRLAGLDPTNDNALGRAIVVHAAWYSNPEMLRTHGMLGRSQGCFAVGDADLSRVFDQLGQGRMIFAAKV